MYFKRSGVMARRHSQSPVLSEAAGRAERYSSRHGTHYRRGNDLAVLRQTIGFPEAMGHRSQQSVTAKASRPGISTRSWKTSSPISASNTYRVGDRNAYVTAEKAKDVGSGFGDGYRLLLQIFDGYPEESAQKRRVPIRRPDTTRQDRTYRVSGPSQRLPSDLRRKRREALRHAGRPPTRS